MIPGLFLESIQKSLTPEFCKDKMLTSNHKLAAQTADHKEFRRVAAAVVNHTEILLGYLEMQNNEN